MVVIIVHAEYRVDRVYFFTGAVRTGGPDSRADEGPIIKKRPQTTV